MPGYQMATEVDTCYDNWPNSQISQWTCSIFHNAPLRTEICTFLFIMVNCGIWNRCIVGLVRLLYCQNSYCDTCKAKRVEINLWQFRVKAERNICWIWVISEPSLEWWYQFYLVSLWVGISGQSEWLLVGWFIQLTVRWMSSFHIFFVKWYMV